MKLFALLCVFLIVRFDLVSAVCSKGVYETGVSDSEKNYIVNKHNELRLLIARNQLPGQPRGINLKRMYWDNNIAIAAQNIANTCVFEHVPVHDSRWAVGQNLYASFDSNYVKGANWTAAILGWWNEHSSYKYPGGFSEKTGHYTQLVWDDTMYVGCGYTHFPIDGQYQYEKIYACNYGPAGNYPRAPYKTGTSGCENLC
ncbi:venom allergen 3-like [Cylas formicarius]|uniref:venom allergen 3-like n=1 Tax=Cylas formicarius TaxID=197179 RepID=UPI002958470C|nr:venom allergen 3-like [Cylas formicarius]